MLNKAYVDLGAIRKNALSVKKILPAATKLCAVVKADAYGHGAVMVASALHPVTDCFAVALTEEGAELRLGGIEKDILVFGRACREDIERAVFYDLTLTAADRSDLFLAEKEGKRQGKKVKIHIKYNTGMNRQGADTPEELSEMLGYAAKARHITIEGIYSHYGAPENEKLRDSANRKFSVAEKLVKSFNEKAIAHISASGGFLAGEYADMVRIGILLYGYKPFETDKIKVKPAMKIFAPVVKNGKLSVGDTAMYGECRADEDTDISVVRYGYADGLPRENIDGQFNNRCMDLTAIKENVAEGRMFPVLTDADALARKYRTISYEILTKASARAEKIYKF